MKVGDTVWKHDRNRRVYEYDNGDKSTSPIYRKSFREMYIIGETRVSWLISYWSESSEIALKNATKIKKAEAGRILFVGEEALDKHCWVHDNQYRISELVRKCSDYDTLKQIEKLLEESV